MLQSLVDAHFRGAISLDAERKLRAHMSSCDECHARYRRRLVLATLDPTALAAEERIGRALGLRRHGARGAWVAAAVGAIAIAAALVLRIATPAPSDGFAARGSVAPLGPSHVQVYCAPRGGAPRLAEDTMRRDDELAFAYANGTGRSRLMIFGVDEHGHVYWYHPAWTNEADDPVAVPVETDGRRHELREAISHELDGRELEIHALFVDRPLGVKEIERRLAGRRAPVGPLDLAGATDEVLGLEVTP